MKLGVIMCILNLIVKQLYVLENHKVFIFRIKVISGRKSLKIKRGALKAPLFSIFRDISI